MDSNSGKPAQDVDARCPAVWRFDLTFRIEVVTIENANRVRFIGDLDALTAKWIRREDPIPVFAGRSYVFDLAGLDGIDMTGIREIRRLQQRIADAGSDSEIDGAAPEVHRLLDLVPFPPSSRALDTASR